MSYEFCSQVELSGKKILDYELSTRINFISYDILSSSYEYGTNRFEPFLSPSFDIRVWLIISV